MDPMHVESAAVPSSDNAPRRALFERICVRPPYFALRDVTIGASCLSATASADTPSRQELGPMIAAEIGRHGTVAGLSSIAMATPGTRRCHYLIQSAKCRFFSVEAPFGAPLSFRAIPQAIRLREASAHIFVTRDEHEVAELEVRYAKIAEDAFAKAFARQRRPGIPGPARKAGLMMRVVGPREALIDRVPEEVCAGHFVDFPALPVTFLMGQFGRLVGSIVGAPFWVTRASLEATSLAWPFEAIRLRVTSVLEKVTYREFDCTASVGACPVASMSLGITLA